MTEQDIMKAAASLRGKRSWAARVKKAGGEKAAARNMRLVRQGKTIPSTPTPTPIDTTGLSAFSGRDYVREAVRRRDGYTCQECGKKWQPGTLRFDVHHLAGECGKWSQAYDRKTETDILITLCHKCHISLACA